MTTTADLKTSNPLSGPEATTATPSHSAETPDPTDGLHDVSRRYSDLLTLAEQRFAAGDLSASVGILQIAVRYIFPGKGLFASPRLERLLIEIGKQIPTDPPAGGRNRNGKVRNVLHVLTHARPVGGDSRYAWRWMQRDASSRHSVAITTQGGVSHLFEIPSALKDATAISGGFLHAVTAPSSKPLEQARELRRSCLGMDVVVLHPFPYDIVPILALAAGCDSVKTIFVNHPDHTFWIGASVAHLIVHLRKQSPAFLRNRRGLNPEQSSILPIPLVPPPQTIARAQAKRELGYAADTTVLLTIAGPFKYSAPGHVGFLELVTPVLDQFPRAVLIAIGPHPEGLWRLAHAQTGGRVNALGSRWDTDLFYAAADVYLDSVPFSSITSLLEAGSRGAPLLGYCSDPELELLGPGAAGLEDTMDLAGDPESYRALLTRYIDDVEFRRRKGQFVQERILSLHAGQKWNEALHEIYANLDQAPDTKCLVAKADAYASGPLNLALVRLYSSVPSSVRTSIREFLGPLPYRSRLSITRRLHQLGLDLCLLNLLPPPLDRVGHSIGRRAKRIMRRLLPVR